MVPVPVIPYDSSFVSWQYQTLVAVVHPPMPHDSPIVRVGWVCHPHSIHNHHRYCNIPYGYHLDRQIPSPYFVVHTLPGRHFRPSSIAKIDHHRPARQCGPIPIERPRPRWHGLHVPPNNRPATPPNTSHCEYPNAPSRQSVPHRVRFQ